MSEPSGFGLLTACAGWNGLLFSPCTLPLPLSA
jgi:hypothetical protein